MNPIEPIAKEHLYLKQRLKDAWTMWWHGEHPKNPNGYEPWWVQTDWLGVIATHTFRPHWWSKDLLRKETKRVLSGTYFVKK